MADSKSKHWLDEIERYHKAADKFEKNAKKIVNRIRLEDSGQMDGGGDNQGKRHTYHILTSNIQTLRPTMFSRVPEIVAERRHRDRDPVGRITAETLQRASNEEVERNGFKDAFDQVVMDLLGPGRGVPWVRFEADSLPDEPVLPNPIDGGYVTQDGAPAPESEVEAVKDGGFIWKNPGMVNERTAIDYIHWGDFAHSPERNWADVERRGWVARKTAMTRREGVNRFGSKFNAVQMSMDTRIGETEKVRSGGDGKQKYAEVWEVWDAVSKKRIFVAKDYDQILEETPDPYSLSNFYPCPRPAYAMLSNEDLFPIPDPFLYWDLLEEINTVSSRIRLLTKDLKLVGCYDASAEGIGTILNSNMDGKMVPVSNMAALIGKSAGAGGGLQGVVQWLPMDFVITALQGMYAAREQIKASIYEISGISDIVRGQVDPREKASQSKIKAQFASQRLDQRRRSVERCARDTARIQVELMAELYSPMTIREQSGFDLMQEISVLEEGQREEIWMQVEELLRSDQGRGFRIDVETDSTVEMDASQTQEARTEFLTSAGNFLNNIVPIIQNVPKMGPLMGELLLFAVRGYRAGRTLETSFEEAVQNIRQEQEAAEQAAQQEQGPPPDPEAEARAAQVQQQAQIEGQKGQAQIQQMQQKGQLEQQKGEMEMAEAQMEFEKIKEHLEVKLENEMLKNEKLRAEIQAKRMQVKP